MLKNVYLSKPVNNHYHNADFFYVQCPDDNIPSRKNINQNNSFDILHKFIYIMA